MRGKTNTPGAPLVFKRWSRKAYAAFASLHRHVVVGVVCVSIAYASMLKEGLLTTVNAPAGPDRAGSEQTDDDDSSGGGGFLTSADIAPAVASISAAVSDSRKAAARHSVIIT